MKRILITGCSGFLASYLTGLLQEEGKNELFGITEVPDFRSHRLEVFNIDIRDRDRFFLLVEKINPDIIFHLAAVTNVGFAWRNQLLTYEVNFIGSVNLMEAVTRFSPGARLILMSSAEVYGNTGKKLIDESTPASVRNPYSLSKYAMEMAADLYITAENLDVIKVRSFNFTGPGQDKKFVSSNFSYQIAAIERGEKEPQIKVGNLSAVRDFSDVRDTVRYLKAIAEKGDRGGVYNLCSGQTYPIEEILHKLLSFSEKEIEVVVEKERLRPVDIPELAGDCSLIREKFDLRPRYSIDQTLLDLLNYWRARGAGAL
ncbi:MAG: GDP-mannose 4,6-dehydratase [Candidatus Aminicenantes bacterium]|nr:GDP-mannose 4,6-dehydratase [Candidatus Aminicenantes bacterium]